MIDKLLMSRAYVEVLQILNYIPKEDYNKIPSEIIKNMELNKDKEYLYTVTHFNDFQRQEMLAETEAILAVLFRDYWATEEQRKRILEKEKFDLNILEKEKRKLYNSDNLFKKTSTLENNNTEDNLLIEYKETFFSKIKNFITNILHINN